MRPALWLSHRADLRLLNRVQNQEWHWWEPHSDNQRHDLAQLCALGLHCGPLAQADLQEDQVLPPGQANQR